MRCFGEYHDDRMCELCGAINGSTQAACYDLHEKNVEARRRRAEIARNCPHRAEEWCDRDPFWACAKPGNVTGKWAPNCTPTEDCATYTTFRGEE